MTEADWHDIVSLASGLGVASMGVVESLKALSLPCWSGRWISLSTLGLGKCRRVLGPSGIAALKAAYGSKGFDLLLEGAWRRGTSECETFLKEGLLLAAKLEGKPQDQLCDRLGRTPKELKEIQEDVAKGGVAGLETIVSAHACAAVAAGRDAYVLGVRLTASVVAMVGSFTMAYMQSLNGGSPQWVKAVIVGVVAVPLAPLIKDLSSFVGRLQRLVPRLTSKA